MKNNFQVTAMKAGLGGKEAVGVERVETVKGTLESSEQSQGSEAWKATRTLPCCYANHSIGCYSYPILQTGRCD